MENTEHHIEIRDHFQVEGPRLFRASLIRNGSVIEEGNAHDVIAAVENLRLKLPEGKFPLLMPMKPEAPELDEPVTPSSDSYSAWGVYRGGVPPVDHPEAPEPDLSAG